MEVPSAKPHNAGHTTHNPDTHNQPNSTQFLDFLMVDAPTVDETPSQPTADKNHQENNNKTSTTSDASDVSFMAFLNFMPIDLDKKSPEPSISDETKNNTKPFIMDKTNTNSTSASSISDDKKPSIIEKMNNVDSKTLEKIEKPASVSNLYQVIENSVGDQTKSSDQNKLDNQNPSEILSKISQDFQLQKMEPEIKPIKPHLQQRPISELIKPESIKTIHDTKLKDHEIDNNQVNVQNIEINEKNTIQTSKSANTNSNTELNLQSLNPSTKHMEVFSHLGNFINSYTAPQASISSYTQNITSIETSKNIPTEPAVELLPATVDAVNQQIYDAKIKIYPPELGPVTAKLKMDKNNAELVILTDNNHVKQIVEANLPQLRDHFQRADINLTHVQVNTAEADHNEQNLSNKHKDEELNINDGSQISSKIASSKEPSNAPDTLIDTFI